MKIFRNIYRIVPRFARRHTIEKIRNDKKRKHKMRISLQNQKKKTKKIELKYESNYRDV